MTDRQDPAAASTQSGSPGESGRPVRGASWLSRRDVRLAVAAGFALSFAASTALMLARGGRLLSAAVRQPIAFNHRKHVQELNLECSVCHAFVETEAFSGLPGADACATCHAEAQGQTAEEARLVALLEKDEPLAWQALFRQPAHVFYSHRRHVVAAKLDCARCHGAIGTSEKPPGRVHVLAMGECVACHEKAGASTHCTACHR